MKQIRGVCLCALWLVTALYSAVGLATAPLYVANDLSSRVVDTLGRALYIIDLSEAAREVPDPDTVPALVRARFHERHDQRSIAAAHALEKVAGFEAEEMTSWIGLSVGAYLDSNQLEKVLRLPFVTSVSLTQQSTALVGAAISST